MSVPARKSRFSIGVYNTGESLWPTAVKLLDNGFMTDQIGIISLQSTFLAVIRPAGFRDVDWTRLQPIVGAVEPLPLLQGVAQSPLVASKGAVRHLVQGKDILPTRAGPSNLGTSAAGPSSVTGQYNIAMQLDEHILAGAMILAVASHSRDQQWLSTRILLEHSNHPVQTHEFRECSPH